MDRKERTLRALQGLPVDRPPMVFWHHFVGADMEKENFVDSHVRFYRETGEDFIKMMCDGFVALPDLNVQRPCDWRHIDNQGERVQNGVYAPADLRRWCDRHVSADAE